MDYIIESVEHRGSLIEVVPDESPQNPREDYHVGTFVSCVRNHAYGDEPYSDPTKYIDREARDQRAAARDGGVFLPVYAYRHGDTIMSVRYGDYMRWPDHQWDCGTVGYVYVTPEEIRTFYGVKRVTKALREQIADVVAHEIDTYSAWCNGNVYGWRLADGDDACYGFYSVEDAIEDATSALDAEYSANRAILPVS